MLTLLRFRITQKASQLSFFLFLLLLSVFGRTAKSFLVNVLTLVSKEACDQDLTDSLNTPIGSFLKLLFRTRLAHDTAYSRLIIR